MFSVGQGHTQHLLNTLEMTQALYAHMNNNKKKLKNKK
jgi:hypothetical protein